jgi:hypothetical protein
MGAITSRAKRRFSQRASRGGRWHDPSGADFGGGSSQTIGTGRVWLLWLINIMLRPQRVGIVDQSPKRDDASFWRGCVSPQCGGVSVMREDITFLGLYFLNMNTEAVAARPGAGADGAPFLYLVTPNADRSVRLDRIPDLHPLYDQAGGAVSTRRPRCPLARSIRPRTLRQALTSWQLFPIGISKLAPASPSSASVLEAWQSCACVYLQSFSPVICRRQACPESTGLRGCCRLCSHPRGPLYAGGGGVSRAGTFAAAIQSVGNVAGTGTPIGAGLEFWTGVTPRAPRGLRRIGAEWLFRCAGSQGGSGVAIWLMIGRFCAFWSGHDCGIVGEGGALVWHPSVVVQDLHHHAATHESVRDMMRLTQQQKG